MNPLLLLAVSVPLAGVSPAPDTAFVTYEHGAVVAVDWIQRRGPRLRSFGVLMQSAAREVTVELGPDESAIHSSTVVSNAGEPPGKPIERTFGPGIIYWSDQVPSSLEQAILRARVIGGRLVTLRGGSLFRDATTPISVERTDSTDWVVTCNQKHYDVLTAPDGRMLSATLPDYGVTIERRVGFGGERYPLWPAYAAAPGAPYRAQAVRIPASGGHVLAGTLTIPPGPGPFPGAVLITGLSPHERNNGAPPWMPFRDLADALSRHGVAVLRVDDRGVGQSTGDHGPSTTFDEAEDVKTEIAWLRARSFTDRRRVVLVGYSEGGLIAPMVAAADSMIAGIVTLAGPGVPGPELARYQIEAAVVRDTSIAPAAREAEIARQLADTLSARERSFLSIDPLAYARRVRCPALILQGGSDLTVPPRSAERLAWQMRAAGNRDVSVRVFAGISHSFLPDPIGLPSGWAYLPGFMTAPEVLEAITGWVSQRLGAPRGR
jgi:dienelactone hydrolase